MSDENKDSLVSLGKLLKFKQKGEKILSNLTSFQFDKINNKEQLFFCECFSLYKAMYNQTEYIFIIEFNFFEINIIGNQDYHKEYEKAFELYKPIPYTLPLKGVYYNKNDNIFSIIYNNSNKDLTLFMENSCIAYDTDNILNPAVKLQSIYNLINIIKDIHKKNKALNLIHPNLLFISKSTGDIYTIDFTFYNFFFCVNKYVNFPICSYFGIFDMNQIDKFDSDESYYQKSDVFIICTLIVYFFRIKTTKPMMNFENTLNDISKIFLLRDDNVSQMCNSIKAETELVRFIEWAINVNYDKIRSINEIEEKFKQCLIERLKEFNLICSHCKMSINIKGSFEPDKQLKILCPLCEEVLCKECRRKESHICSNEEKKKLKKQFQDKLIFTKYIDNFEMISEIKGKEIMGNFITILDDIFNEFNTKTEKVKRKIKKEELYINELNNYINGVLFEFANKKYKDLKLQIETLKTEEANINNIVKPSIKHSSTISYGYNSIEEKINKLNKDIEDYKNFTSDSNEVLSYLLYDYSIAEKFELLHAKISYFSSKLNQEFITFYKESTQNLIKNAVDIYSNAIGIEDNDIINETLIQEDNYNNVLLQENIFYITSIETEQETDNIEYVLIKYNGNRDPSFSEPIKVTFNRHQTIHVDNTWRTLHLKTRCILTKGKNAYSIFYENENNVHKVELLPSMIYEHSNHMIISYNVFDIIVIGGENTKAVEIYNFLDSKWEPLSPLNREHTNGCAYLHNERYLYVFGGVDSNNEDCLYIERLDLIKNNCREWEAFQLTGAKVSSIKRGATMKGDDKTVIVFGGYCIEEYMNTFCYEINLETHEMTQNKMKVCNQMNHYDSMMIHVGDNKYFEKS